MLVVAEKLSAQDRQQEAELKYDCAIRESQSSKFIHEEALACELAGMHYERKGNTKKAVSLFRQAEQCYKVWGSPIKMLQMMSKIQLALIKKVSSTEENG